MALGSLNLKVSKQDFLNRIDAIQAKMDRLSDVIQKYRDLKTNLDQFVEPEDNSYEVWVARIDEHINAAGRAKAALNESKKTLQQTVDQMDEFGNVVKQTVSSATEATKSTVEAAIKIAPLL